MKIYPVLFHYNAFSASFSLKDVFIILHLRQRQKAVRLNFKHIYFPGNKNRLLSAKYKITLTALNLTFKISKGYSLKYLLIILQQPGRYIPVSGIYRQQIIGETDHAACT